MTTTKTITFVGVPVLFLGLLVMGGSKARDQGAPRTAPLSVGSVVAKGGRQLGIALSSGEMGFERAFTAGKAAGLQVTTLGLYWDVVEPAPGRFEAGDNPKIDNFFGTQGISLALGLDPIDTFANRLPKDLQTKSFDDPAVFTRFQQAVDFVLRQFPRVTVSSFNIGNEVDAFLGGDARRWEAYQTFFHQAADYVRSKRPGMKVGVKLTFGGLTGPNQARAQALNRYADVILVTYYPLKSDFQVQAPAQVHQDFATLASLYPGKPVHFLEIGYPSSTALGSSEANQARFVHETFRAWDAHLAQIPLLTFFSLSDSTRAERDRAVKYFGVSGNAFAEYLGTLGLYHATGTAKQGYGTLLAEAKARGW